MKFNRLLLPFLLLAPAACSDPVRPDSIQGRYSLGFVAGRELPAAVQAGANCGITIEAGELTLERDGTFTSTVTGEQRCRRSDGGTTVTPGAFFREGEYVELNAAVELRTELEGTLRGTVRGLSITIPAPEELGRQPLTFLRNDL